mmetsp:Transcript_114974/g.330224  ORF Transcript_114974/g.330224 Transcript_114974/m.330224 type:complete len:226 (-) Transcript_114974:583-1260(-)
MRGSEPLLNSSKGAGRQSSTAPWARSAASASATHSGPRSSSSRRVIHWSPRTSTSTPWNFIRSSTSSTWSAASGQMTPPWACAWRTLSSCVVAWMAPTCGCASGVGGSGPTTMASATTLRGSRRLRSAWAGMCGSLWRSWRRNASRGARSRRLTRPVETTLAMAVSCAWRRFPYFSAMRHRMSCTAKRGRRRTRRILAWSPLRLAPFSPTWSLGLWCALTNNHST